MKFLIAGSKGQLAREFIRVFEQRSISYTAPEESVFDIRDGKAVEELVVSVKPDVILNCAAYNLVDKAEQEPDVAFGINAEGPRNLARAAAKQDCMLVHFGTDHVFDGTKETGPYIETDKVNPLNKYGESKLAGERYVLEEHARSLVLRLSWVFGDGQQNFIHKMLHWASTQEFLKVTCDEFSSPTSTHTVANVTLKAIEERLRGMYLLSNGGFCSRYEWAQHILSFAGIKKFIRPVSIRSFELPAQRPFFSAMSNKSIATALSITIPTWEEAVEAFMNKERP